MGGVDSSINVWHGTIRVTDDPKVLITPPGYIVFVAPVNDKHVMGIRKSILRKGTKSCSSFRSVLTTGLYQHLGPIIDLVMVNLPGNLPN